MHHTSKCKFFWLKKISLIKIFFLKPTQVNKLATVVVTDGTTSATLNQQLTYDYSSTPVRIFSIFKIILVGRKSI